MCGKLPGKLTIVYEDHPQKDVVDLLGEVNFPNLHLDASILDFGSILNETTKQMTLTMTDKELLAVNYKSRKQQAKRLLEFCYFLYSTSLDKNFGHNHTLQTLQVKMIIPNANSVLLPFATRACAYRWKHCSPHPRSPRLP